MFTAALQHVIGVHGHAEDEPGLHETLRSHLVDADDAVSSSGAFVQLFEFATDRIEEWDGTPRTASPTGSAQRAPPAGRSSPPTGDADGRYVGIVEFPDYEQAMANSGHPATGEFLSELTKICEDEPTFRNLTVRRARPY